MVSFIGSEHTFFDESGEHDDLRYRNDVIYSREDLDLLDLGPY